jgi:hypothetical protein
MQLDIEKAELAALLRAFLALTPKQRQELLYGLKLYNSGYRVPDSAVELAPLQDVPQERVPLCLVKRA